MKAVIQYPSEDGRVPSGDGQVPSGDGHSSGLPLFVCPHEDIPSTANLHEITITKYKLKDTKKI